MNNKCWKESFQRWIKKYSFLVSLLCFLFLGFTVLKLVGCGVTHFEFVPGGADCVCCDSNPLELCCEFPLVPNEDGTRCISSVNFCEENPGHSTCDINDVLNNNLCNTYPDDPSCDHYYTIRDPQDPENSDSVENGEGRNNGGNNENNGSNNRGGTTVSKTVHLGKVDILFVVDNSSSMHEEHKNIENQFSDFMDDIEDLDYRIALTTVDISRSPGNVDREYQDGRFIDFDDNSIFLHNSEEDKQERRERHRRNVDSFKRSIVRDETRQCEYEEDDSQCPTDERAICALNEALGRSKESSFFRTDPDVHFMIVIISDEDERSSQSYIDFKGQDEYGFEHCDEPETLHLNIYNRLGPSKSYSVHSIIIPPGDQSCLNQQEDNKGIGYVGETYAKLSHPSGSTYDNFPGLYKGSIISICERNYSSQLNVLSDYLLEPKPITLTCEIKEGSVSIRKGQDDVRFRVEGKKVIIEERIPVNSSLRIRYTCLRV